MALLPYVPKRNASTEAQKRLNQFIFWFKDGKTLTRGESKEEVSASHLFAEIVQEIVERQESVRKVFPAAAALVPIPKSTPEVGSWPQQELAQALVERGLARVSIPALRRSKQIQRASQARREGKERPSVSDHLDSFEVDLPERNKSDHIVLLDDTVTSGTQMVGAARALAAAGHSGEVTCLALMHTRSECIESFEELPGIPPKHGFVAWSDHLKWAEWSLF